ncbi:MAG: GNAT family N-acetyltransferase [Alcaligenaceae bacterium]
MNAETSPAVQHDAAKQCFFLFVDAQRCVLDYTLQDQIMTITHTGVPDALGGRGLAAQLTKFALDHAHAQQWKVIPRCSYAAVYIRRHTEYATLVA